MVKIEYEQYNSLEELLKETPSPPRSIIDDNSYSKDNHWPSSLTSCRRRMVFDFDHLEDWDKSLNDEITFAMGHAFEDVIVKKFKDAKLYMGDEQAFKLRDPRLKFPISGRVDIIVSLPGEEGMFPVELKTMNNKNWVDAQYGTMTFPGGSSKPKLYHVAQLTTYMHQMKKPFGLLAYMNKDTSEFKIWKIWYNEEFFDTLIEHLAAAESDFQTYKETGELTPAVLVNDDGEFYEITAPALDVFKRPGKIRKEGDPKIGKANKKEGITKFPCIWYSEDSGTFTTCSHFNRCHADRLEELDLTMEDLNRGYKL